MNRFQYPILLTPAEEGGDVVSCRDLPQLVAQGDTAQEAPAGGDQQIAARAAMKAR